MMKRFCAVMLCGLGLLTGCTPATVNSVDIGSDRPENAIITDPKLANWASVRRVTKGHADDLFRVQVEVTNRTDSPHEIMYRFVWLDDSGQTVDTPLTTWQRVQIQGQQTVSLKGVAPDARVLDARVEMVRPES